MSLTIARLAAEKRTFNWHHLGEEVEITYRPGVLTIAWASGTPVAEALAQTLISIDITNDKGKPIALDAESLNKTLPQPIMQRIAAAIYEDANLDPTTAETSGAS